MRRRQTGPTVEVGLATDGRSRFGSLRSPGEGVLMLEVAAKP
jgi:hypothetical protein